MSTKGTPHFPSGLTYPSRASRRRPNAGERKGKGQAQDVLPTATGRSIRPVLFVPRQIAACNNACGKRMMKKSGLFSTPLVKRGQSILDAYASFKEDMGRFPSVYGSRCYHPVETACNVAVRRAIFHFDTRGVWLVNGFLAIWARGRRMSANVGTWL